MPNKRRPSLKVEKVLVLPPDGGWGWVVVGSAFYCILVMDGISNTFTLFIPIFEKEFDTSVSQISVINSLFTGFYFIFAPVAGSLSNRFGFRSIIIAGSIISAAGIAVSIFTNNVELMSATYGLFGGLGFSMMYINVVLTVGFYFEKWRALATGITVSASGVGTLSFAPLVQLLLQMYSWRHIFIGYSCLVCTCAVVAICFRPLPAINIDEPEGADMREKSTENITSMHNAKYPTAAEALDINIQQLNENRLNTLPSWYSSMESFELTKYNPSRKTSRNVEMRRHTEFSLFESIHDLTVPGTSRPHERHKCWKRLRMSCRCTCCRGCKNRHECCRKGRGVRPLYRDDIFYEGSLAQLSDYERNSNVIKTSLRSSSAAKMSLLYHLSVSRLPTRKDLQEESDGRCHWCPESITRALKTMFDFKVMKYPLFLLFTLSTCFLAAGVNVPTYFTYVRATDMGVMNEAEASLILTAMGITNTVGRIICGLVGSMPKVNMVILHFSFLSFGALINVCIVFFSEKEVFYIYSALYGLVLAEQGSLRSVILVQLVGLENLTNAFGILLLFLGLFTVVGTPAAGYMRDLFGTYDAVFIFSSVFLLLSAVSLTPLFLGRQRFKGVQKVQAPAATGAGAGPATGAGTGPSAGPGTGPGTGAGAGQTTSHATGQSTPPGEPGPHSEKTEE